MAIPAATFLGTGYAASVPPFVPALHLLSWGCGCLSPPRTGAATLWKLPVERAPPWGRVFAKTGLGVASRAQVPRGREVMWRPLGPIPWG